MAALRRSARLSNQEQKQNAEENDTYKRSDVGTSKDVHHHRKCVGKRKTENNDGPSTLKQRRTSAISAASKKEKPRTEINAESSKQQSVAANHHEREVQRLRLMLQYERQIMIDEYSRSLEHHKGSHRHARASMQKFAIIGVDEVGVGPLAGPCVSAAVWLGVLPLLNHNNDITDDDDDDKKQNDEAENKEWQFGVQTLYGLNDSKQLKQDVRERLSNTIQSTKSYAHALGICTSQEVDVLNPRAASMEAMRRAVMQLLQGPLNGYRVHLLVDYHTVPDMPKEVIGQTCLTKGDAKSQSIAAASVVAKVHRDAYMLRLHAQYPHFGFDRNVGYGTRQHMDALQRGLLCPEHRLSFAPVRAAQALAQKQQDLDQDENDSQKKMRPTTTTTGMTRMTTSSNSRLKRLSRSPLLPHQLRVSPRVDDA